VPLVEKVMAFFAIVTCLAAMGGLAARRRWALIRFFSAYLAFSAIVTPMFLFWPDRFYHQWFALIMQTGFDVLKFGIAIEIAWHTFRPFPAARSVALLVAVVLLVATARAAAVVPVGDDAWEWEVVVGHFFPRIKAGTVWLMASTLVLARWYRVPVHPFHAAILTSLVAYVGIACVLGSFAVDATGAFVHYTFTLSVMDMIVEAAMRCYWVALVWRPDTSPILAHGETVRRLEWSVALARSRS
jgi:hypothetical protein